MNPNRTASRHRSAAAEPDEKVLTLKELGRKLRRSERTLRRLGLPQILRNRYLYSDVLAHLRKQNTKR